MRMQREVHMKSAAVPSELAIKGRTVSTRSVGTPRDENLLWQQKGFAAV